MNIPNIWICPASPENLQLSIENELNGKYAWAFNATKRNQWEKLQVGDICIFGNIDKRYNLGYKWVSFVIEKQELKPTEDSWNYRSPSGTAWKYAFFLTPPFEVNISKQQFLSIRPSGSPQTQIMARGEEARKLKEIIEAATIGRMKPKPN